MIAAGRDSGVNEPFSSVHKCNGSLSHNTLVSTATLHGDCLACKHDSRAAHLKPQVVALDLQCVHGNVGVVLGGCATTGRGVDCGVNEATQSEDKRDAERAKCGHQRRRESSVSAADS